MQDEKLIQEVTAKAQTWLTDGYDAETQAEVKKMIDNEDKTDLIESFYKDLEFGTGGLRGIMGVGSNRMNIYTVGAATQGLSNYLNEVFADRKEISVVVGHDVRNNSRKFAEIVAAIFSANGIKAYLFDGCRPTPEMSFAIRELGCQSGVIITASHNPKEYNGYKAYWEDGAQIIAPHDTNIIDNVGKIKSVKEIKFEANPELIVTIGKDIDDKFLARIKELSINPENNKKHHDLKIVYTPIHGTGRDLIPASLRNFGFDNIIHVPEQDIQDGNFPTVDSPNPENASAMAMAIEKAKETNADIVMASDPDADRLGVVIRNDKGEYVLLNGNQIQIVFHNYIMRATKAKGLKGNEYIVKTIVTSELIKNIADAEGIKMYDVYTGFKWIADIIRKNEGKGKYIGGGEESFGFLAEDFTRDKNSVSAISLMAEICAWAKENGQDMQQMIKEMYLKYGFSKEKGVSLVRTGKSGAEEIVALMKKFRENPPAEIVGSPVTIIKDYQTLKQTANGVVSDIVMPATSNVLQWFCEDGTKVSVRPSGTEPKIKFYIEVKDKMNTLEDYDRVDAAAEKKVAAIMAQFGI